HHLLDLRRREREPASGKADRGGARRGVRIAEHVDHVQGGGRKERRGTAGALPEARDRTATRRGGGPPGGGGRRTERPGLEGRAVLAGRGAGGVPGREDDGSRGGEGGGEGRSHPPTLR